jgi:hypothetical protein
MNIDSLNSERERGERRFKELTGTHTFPIVKHSRVE